jgi:MFS family permease
MGKFMDDLRETWSHMFLVPWRRGRSDESDQVETALRWLLWLIGVVWVVAGLILGAVANSTLSWVTSWLDSPYRDALAIGVTALTGLLALVLGGCLVALVDPVLDQTSDKPTTSRDWLVMFLLLAIAFLVVVGIPLVGVGFGFAHIIFWAAGRNTTSLTFVGGLLLAVLLLWLINSIRKSAYV